ncbi:MAG: DUF4007 family protein [Clostridia bacterium]
MKFRGHESFFIRKGWLYKGLKNTRECPAIFTSKDINAMDVLGIGSNMVKSLRYWLQAVRLTSEPERGTRAQTPTALADIIWESDRYMEELGTLWLLHYELASNEENATAWYFLFNKFKMSEFKKDDFVFALSNYAAMSGVEVAQGSLEDDFDCIINTYISKNKSNPERALPESNIDCPIGELGLIEIANRREKTYRKVQPKRNTLHPLIVLSIIIDQANGLKEVKIARLLNDANNIGKIFNLDIMALTGYLYQIATLGYIEVVRTAGLDTIKIKTKMTFQDCVQAYYEELAR